MKRSCAFNYTLTVHGKASLADDYRSSITLNRFNPRRRAACDNTSIKQRAEKVKGQNVPRMAKTKALKEGRSLYVHLYVIFSQG